MAGRTVELGQDDSSSPGGDHGDGIDTRPGRRRLRAAKSPRGGKQPLTGGRVAGNPRLGVEAVDSKSRRAGGGGAGGSDGKTALGGVRRGESGTPAGDVGCAA